MKKICRMLPLLMLFILLSGCVIGYDPIDQEGEIKNYLLDANASSAILDSGKEVSSSTSVCAGNVEGLNAKSVYPLANCIAYKMVGTEDEIKNDTKTFADYCLTTAYNYVSPRVKAGNDYEFARSLDSVDPYEFGSDNYILGAHRLFFFSNGTTEYIAFPLEHDYYVIGGYNGEVVVKSEVELQEAGFERSNIKYCNDNYNGLGCAKQ